MDLSIYNTDSIIVKDLRINLTKLLSREEFDQDLYYLVVLVAAKKLKYHELYEQALIKLKHLDEKKIQEAELSIGIVSMLNSYYKAKNLLSESHELGPAELRMQSLFNPVLGKKYFEAISLAISILNYCPYCIKAHTTECLKQGLTITEVHDIIRLSCVISGLASI